MKCYDRSLLQERLLGLESSRLRRLKVNPRWKMKTHLRRKARKSEGLEILSHLTYSSLSVAMIQAFAYGILGVIST
jgi:hypothetical protein